MRKEPAKLKIFFKVVGRIIFAAPCFYWFYSNVLSDSQRIFRLAFLFVWCLMHLVNITKQPTKTFLMRSFWRWLMSSLIVCSHHANFGLHNPSFGLQKLVGLHAQNV